jgi:HSP20 family protein
MLMNRISPRHLFEEVQNAFDLFDELTTASRPQFSPAAFPALNAWSDEEHFYLEAEIPGMSLDDLDIFVSEGQVLTIKGRRAESQIEGSNWLRRERGSGAFERQIQLPGPINQEGVDATLKQGVLTIKLPKAQEIRPKRINVKAV